ncbi:DUF2809 domain-containing protein [Streptomyces sp. NPDC048623]|uniref:ribosomal maturation YjgA family protein n=1 Tax=Streptomyces sp. NPDC048623 TaxID=3155761 RepID=UPI00342F370C
MRMFLRTRLVACCAALLTVAAGLGIRSAASGVVAKYAGDALYTILVLTVVVSVAPRVRPGVAAGVALGVSCGVELFQLTGVPAELAARSALARLVLGTTFNGPDLFWYAIGAAVGWAVHRAVGARRGRGQALGTIS